MAPSRSRRQRPLHCYAHPRHTCHSWHFHALVVSDGVARRDVLVRVQPCHMIILPPALRKAERSGFIASRDGDRKSAGRVEVVEGSGKREVIRTPVPVRVAVNHVLEVTDSGMKKGSLTVTPPAESSLPVARIHTRIGSGGWIFQSAVDFLNNIHLGRRQAGWQVLSGRALQCSRGCEVARAGIGNEPVL